MKLAIVLSTQPASFSALAYKGELETNLEKIARLGYDGVELAVREPARLDVPHVSVVLARLGLEVPAIGTGQAYGEEGLSFTHPEASVRDQAVARIQAHVDLAASLDALVILGLIRGKVEAGVSREQALVWLREALHACCAYAAPRGVRFAMEPINRYETDLVNTVEEGLQLIEEVGADNLGLLLDTFHMNIEEPAIEASIRRAGPRIFHFHVADSNRWYPGAGHLDFPALIHALRDTGYHGYVSAEILPHPDPDTCAAKTIETMRPLLT